MRIGGLQKLSLIDYPGKLSCIVFTIGCNLRCPYCYNVDLVRETSPTYPEEEVFKFLENRRGLLDGVVVTGGEPTLQPDLAEFCSRVKDLGFLLALETNGTNPDVLGDLFSRGLVDFVAMDIKAPLFKYPEITRAKVDVNNIRRSIAMILESGVDHEFRTTCYPSLGIEDFEEIFQLARGAKKYALQQFSPKRTLAESVPEPYPEDFLMDLKGLAEKYLDHVDLRT